MQIKNWNNTAEQYSTSAQQVTLPEGRGQQKEAAGFSLPLRTYIDMKKAFYKGLSEANTSRFNKHTNALDFNTMQQSLFSAAVAGFAGCLLKNTD